MQETNRTAGSLLLESNGHLEEEMLSCPAQAEKKRSWQGATEEASGLCSSKSTWDWHAGEEGTLTLCPWTGLRGGGSPNAKLQDGSAPEGFPSRASERLVEPLSTVPSLSYTSFRHPHGEPFPFPGHRMAGSSWARTRRAVHMRLAPWVSLFLSHPASGTLRGPGFRGLGAGNTMEVRL